MVEVTLKEAARLWLQPGNCPRAKTVILIQYLGDHVPPSQLD